MNNTQTFFYIIGIIATAGIILSAIAFFIFEQKDTRTPYEQHRDYFNSRKRNYEQNHCTWLK